MVDVERFALADCSLNGIPFGDCPMYYIVIPVLQAVAKCLNIFNRIQAIRVFAVRVTPIFTGKTHGLNT
jgi:hypothetical protein